MLAKVSKIRFIFLIRKAWWFGLFIAFHTQLNQRSCFWEYLAYWRENTGQSYNFHKSWYRMLAQRPRARGYSGNTAHISRTGEKGAWEISVHTVSNDYIKVRSTSNQPWGEPRGFLFPQKCGFRQETHYNKLYHMAPNQKLTFKQLPKNCQVILPHFYPFQTHTLKNSRFLATLGHPLVHILWIKARSVTAC